MRPWERWFVLFAAFTSSTYMVVLFTAVLDRLHNGSAPFNPGLIIYEAPLAGLRLTLGQAWDAALLVNEAFNRRGLEG